MAYNGFPATYQPMFYQPQYQPVMQTPVQQPQQAQPQNTSIIWVQGEAAARGYLMAPNTTLPLWDSESNTIFLKTTDAAGMPSMKILEYSIRENAPTMAPAAANNAPVDLSNYATKTDLDAISSQISTLRAQIDGMAAKRAVVKKEAHDE